MASITIRLVRAKKVSSAKLPRIGWSILRQPLFEENLFGEKTDPPKKLKEYRWSEPGLGL